LKIELASTTSSQAPTWRSNLFSICPRNNNYYGFSSLPT
jgi:hypothetical protein